MTMARLSRAATVVGRRSLSSLSSRASGAGPLAPFLQRQGAVVMDGGFGTALGSDSEADVLWGAQHLFTSDGHARIEAVHRAFLDAGADIISTSSYQVSFEIFSTAGTFAQLPGGAIEDEKHQLRYTRDVLRTTVELAKKARHEHERAQGDSAGAARLRPLVAASVGPAGDNITLWSGATDPNTNDHGLPDAVVSQYYARKLGALALAKPDLVLLETLPSLREARLALAALDEAAPELPAIVAFICRSEELTAAGDVFAEACAEVAAHPRVAAVGLSTRPPRSKRPRRSKRAPAAERARGLRLSYDTRGGSGRAREGTRAGGGGRE
jgi:homocysteine S-methyltransferase